MNYKYIDADDDIYDIYLKSPLFWHSVRRYRIRRTIPVSKARPYSTYKALPDQFHNNLNPDAVQEIRHTKKGFCVNIIGGVSQKAEYVDKKIKKADKSLGLY